MYKAILKILELERSGLQKALAKINKRIESRPLNFGLLIARYKLIDRLKEVDQEISNISEQNY